MSSELFPFPLEVTENPGLETIDPRLDEIITLVQDGNYESAAAQSAGILEEETYDIRIIGYYLYGHFLDQGVGALGEIFDCLAEILRENLEAVGPVRNREKQFQTILNWLMKQLVKKLQYEESRDSGLYQGWVEQVSSDQVQEALDAADALRRALGPALEDAAGPVLDGLMKSGEWLSAFQRLVYREPEAEEEEPDPEEDWAEEEPEMEAAQQQKVRKAGTLSLSLGGGEGAGVEGSHHLKELMRKLEAFDLLISADNYTGAALVADDINGIIAGFDPRLYFPKLFAGFTLQYVKNIGELVAYDEYKGGIEWQAMQELYKVDLEGFVNFQSGGMSLGSSGGGGDYGEQQEYGDMAEDEDASHEEEPHQEEPYEDDDNADDGW